MKKEGKKGQITLFVIIGIILFSAIGGLVYFSSIKNNESPATTGQGLTVSQAASIIKEQRDACARNISIDALDYYGLDNENVKKAIEENLEKCMGPILNKYKTSFDITSKLNSAEVSIDDENVEINVDYTAIVKKGAETRSIDKYEIIFPRTISREIEHDSSCKVKSSARLASFDSRFEIFIEDGTIAKNKDGSCLQNISIRLEDPVKSYGDRTTGLTAITYIPQPLGAEFSEKNAELKLKYSEKDYNDYYNSLSEKNYYPASESQLKMQYYDKESRNFFVYPSDNTLLDSADITKNIMTAKVNQFYDGNLHTSADGKVSRKTIIESQDKRVNLVFLAGVIAQKSDGSSVDKININMKPKTSNVVNFGYYDYDLLPNGATFSPSVIYIYKYTQADADSDTFRYGYYQWENLINNTWQSPVSPGLLAPPLKGSWIDKLLTNIKNAFTGKAVSNSNAEFKSRREGELKIAYYDNGIYRPWPTYVDAKNNIIRAEIGHFSVDIAAQGCEDEAYGYFQHVSTIEHGEDLKDPNNTDLGYVCPGAAVQKNVKYTITKDNSCGNNKIIELTPKYSINDGGTLIHTQPSGAGDGKFYVSPLIDGDNEQDSRPNGLCAWADVYMKIKGVGINSGYSEGLSGNISEAQYFSGLGINNSELGGFTEENCYENYGSEEEEEENIALEACLACVGFAAEDIENSGGRVGTAGDTLESLDFCTETIAGEMEGIEEEEALGEIGNCYATTGGYDSDTSWIMGYGVENYWMLFDYTELAKQISENGLTATHVELLSERDKNYYDRVNELPAAFNPFISAMRAKNITTFINVVNWNYGGQEGETSVCDSRYDDAWFQSILNYIISLGTDKIILQHASEWSGGRNSECDDKAQRWHDMTVSQWGSIGGKISYNKGSRPTSAPSSDMYIEYHPCSSDSSFPDGSILTTDCGGILEEINSEGDVDGYSNPAKLEEYAKETYLKCNIGFIYYGHKHKQIDSAAIQALGRVAKEKPAKLPSTLSTSQTNTLIINITSPKDQQIYNSNSVTLSITSNKDLSAAAYTLNYGENITMTSATAQITGQEGLNILTVFGQASEGTLGSSTIMFGIDSSQ